MTDAGVRALAKLHNLKRLEIGTAAITDAGLAVIGGMPALTYLRADGPR